MLLTRFTLSFSFKPFSLCSKLFAVECEKAQFPSAARINVDSSAVRARLSLLLKKCSGCLQTATAKTFDPSEKAQCFNRFHAKPLQTFQRAASCWERTLHSYCFRNVFIFVVVYSFLQCFTQCFLNDCWIHWCSPIVSFMAMLLFWSLEQKQHVEGGWKGNEGLFLCGVIHVESSIVLWKQWDLW